MPTLFVSALFIDEQGRLLLARRKGDAPPFAGLWVLPADEMGEDETAEAALVRIVRRELRVTVTAFQFYDTLYLDTEAGQRIENVFVVAAWDGKLGYRTHGVYEVVRWFSIDQVPTLPMPEPVRAWLVTRFLSQGAATVANLDQDATWDTLSVVGREEQRAPPDVVRSPAAFLSEAELGLIGDVTGKCVLEIGCGDGHNLITLAANYQAALIGIDPAEEQVRSAQERAQSEGVQATFYQSALEALPPIADQSQDVVFSVGALAYVEQPDRCFAEVFRVLRPGGTFVFSVAHPFSQIVSLKKPWLVERSYWDKVSDWDWDAPARALKDRLQGPHRTVADWFASLRSAGFTIETILEPPPTATMLEAAQHGPYPAERMQLIPTTIIFRARKPR